MISRPRKLVPWLPAALWWSACASNDSGADGLAISNRRASAVETDVASGPHPSAPLPSAEPPIVTAAPRPAPPERPAACPAPLAVPAPRALTLHEAPAQEASRDTPFERLDSEATAGFPATSEDGARMAEIGYDSEDFSGYLVERIRFRSLPNGRILSTFTLYDQRELSRLAPGAEGAVFQATRRNWQLANEALASSKWIPMRRRVQSEEPCGTWASLDSDRLGGSARFDRPDVAVVLDPFMRNRSTTMSVIRTRPRGLERAPLVAAIPSPGRSVFVSPGSPCGDATAMSDGYVSQDGKTLLLLPRYTVGGDNCKALLELDRWVVTSMPKETEFVLEGAGAP